MSDSPESVIWGAMRGAWLSDSGESVIWDGEAEPGAAGEQASIELSTRLPITAHSEAPSMPMSCGIAAAQSTAMPRSRIRSHSASSSAFAAGWSHMRARPRPAASAIRSVACSTAGRSRRPNASRNAAIRTSTPLRHCDTRSISVRRSRRSRRPASVAACSCSASRSNCLPLSLNGRFGNISTLPITHTAQHTGSGSIMATSGAVRDRSKAHRKKAMNSSCAVG